MKKKVRLAEPNPQGNEIRFQELQYFQNSTDPLLVGQGVEELEVESQERLAKRWPLSLQVIALLQGPSGKPGRHSHAVPGAAFSSWLWFLSPLPLPFEGDF